jgi:hypothetical protein
MTLAVGGTLYLALGFLLWVHAWVEGATTHTLCGCGDPALFLWFFQWPATALAHGQNPFFSSALFHPGGINLLAQTSVTGLSLPLVPVTWIWGPVASLNVASTIAPALTAFTAFVVIRRWVTWTPAAFLGGLLYGFSPFVLSSLEFAHLMTAALMVLPLILAALDEILIRQRHGALRGGLLLALLVFAQFFLSSELLAIVAVVVVVCVVVLVAAALVTDPGGVRARFPHAATGLAVGLGLGVVLLAWPVWFALRGPASLSGLVWPNVGVIGGFIPSSFVTTVYPPRSNVFLRLGGYEGAPLASSAFLGWSFLAVMVAGLVAFWRDRRLWFFGFVLVVCAAFSLGERHGQWEPAWIFTRIPVVENVIEQRFMAVGFLAAAVIACTASCPTGGARAARWPWPRSRSCRWASSSATACPSPCRRSRCPAGTAKSHPHCRPAGSCCPTPRRSPGCRTPWRGRRSTACTTARRVAEAPREWSPGPARRRPASTC